MSELRLALLTYSTRPRGGVVHTLALAEALAELGADVTVATLCRDPTQAFFRPVDPRVRIAVAPMEPIDDEPFGDRIERSIATLATACDWDAFDVVHAQDCISANAVPHCIRTVHHIDHFTTPQLVACHERAIVRPYAHVCVSDAVAAELLDGWDITATVIPNGVDAARFRAGADDLDDQRRWRDEIGGDYVIAVGGIEPRKGTLQLIEAWPHVAAARPDLRLVIAGGETLFDYGDYRASVDLRRAELGVEVIELGTIEHQRLPALVAAAAALAMPSTKEGFGLSAMEALAAGTPVALSDLPVFREFFGGVGHIAADDSSAALAAAIIAAAGSRTDTAQTEVGRTVAGRYSWRAAAESHFALYRNILDGAGVLSPRTLSSDAVERPARF